MSARIACLALALALSVVSTSQSRAANLLEKNFWLSGPRYDQVLPPCDYRAALDRIVGDFQIKEARFWNSRLHAIFYTIVEDTGMIGIDWGVNFCVVGLDRNLAHGPACRAARP
jgi:hypothetical protein